MSKNPSGALSRAAKAAAAALLSLLAVQVSHGQPGPAVGAKVKVLSLVEKTRLAPQVLTGRVTAVEKGRLTLALRRALKGSAARREIEVVWTGKPLGELQPPPLREGDEVLAFLERKAAALAPVGGPQGIVPLSRRELAEASQAVAAILRFDAARTPVGRTRVLEQMLGASDHTSQASALEMIYLEYHTGSFAIPALVQPVVRLSASTDRSVALFAIQVLSRIGSKAAVPSLIERVGAADPGVATAAHRTLLSLTAADVRVVRKGLQSPAGRRLAMERWQAWWAAHGDAVALRH